MLKTGQQLFSRAMKAFNFSNSLYIIDVEAKISLLDCFSSYLLLTTIERLPGRTF
jgi:hypothetical protein